MNNKSISTLFGPLGLLGVFAAVTASLSTAGCGKDSVVKSDSGGFGDLEVQEKGSKAGESVEKTSLVVSLDQHANGATLYTASQKMDIFNVLKVTGLTEATKKRLLKDVSTKLTMSRSESVVFEKTKPGANFNWELPFKDEGVYSVSLSASHLRKDLLPSSPPFSLRIQYDVTPPELAIESTMVTNPKTGVRTVDVKLSGKDQSPLSCDKVEIYNIALPQANRLKLDLVKFEQEKGLQVIGWKGLSLNPEFGQPLGLQADCKDAAGNRKERSLPLMEDSSPYQLSSSLKLGRGKHPQKPTEQILFANADLFEIQHTLLSSQNLEPLHQSVVERERSKLKVYISAENPDALGNGDLQALKIKNTTTAVPFVETHQHLLPNPWVSGAGNGERTLYLTLAYQASPTDVEKRLSTVSQPIFVDAVGPAAVAWETEAQYLPAVKDQPFVADFRVDFAGAPLKDVSQFSAEYSTDALKWITLPGSTFSAVDLATAKYRIASKYPLSAETPFRVRVKLADLAGNGKVSPYSFNLFGKASFSAVDSTARTLCSGAGGAPRSLLQIEMAASFYCLENTTLMPVVPVYLRNFGSKELVYKNSSAPQLGYRFDDESAGGRRYAKFEAPGEFSLASFLNKPLVRNIKLPVDYFSITLNPPSNIILEADVEDPIGNVAQFSTASNSTCYQRLPSGHTYPRVYLREQSVNKIERSPFKCSPD